jgi:glycosyltransferase involved in cell wall biosynthesis
MLISFIVPVYNVYKYVRRCVESLTAQTYSDIEVILVDDGSTDGSSGLCDRLSEEDRRIRVIHKENGGLSDARNTGLRDARGEYVVFVDSDDFWPNDASLSYLVDTVQKEESLDCI